MDVDFVADSGSSLRPASLGPGRLLFWSLFIYVCHACGSLMKAETFLMR